MNRFVCASIVMIASIVGFFWGCAPHQPVIPFTYTQQIPASLYLPMELEARLLDYWTLKSTDRMQAAYDMEAPYIRELTPFPIYAELYAKSLPVEKLEIVSINPVSNLYYEIGLKLFIRKKNDQIQETFMSDKWVNAEKTWFHVIKDPVLKRFFP